MNQTQLPVDPILPYPRTHTVQVDTASVPTPLFTNIVHELNRFSPADQIPKDYHQFPIPKHSGGFRIINAPNPTLKEYQANVAKFLQSTCKILCHDAAFAYIPKRCAKHAVQRHQNSKWFLKLDIKDFFPNMTEDFVYNTLFKLFPFAAMQRTMELNNFPEILSLCFLDGALPQGSPASPILSNLAMIPYDLEISRTLQNFDAHNLTYTRYADDMLISCPFDFNHQRVADAVQSIIQTQFKIKSEKTRYGSSSGRNWNLGLMLNKDQQITVGHARKDRVKSMMFNLMKDGCNSTLSKQELQVVQGELAYIANIEPRYMQELDMKYRMKLNTCGYQSTLSYLLKRT